MSEEALRGGFVSDVVRVGATVRKSPPPDPVFVRRLLKHFESADWPGAPRFLGVDDRGRETLTFLDGHVPWQPDAEPSDDAGLAGVARLVRQFHDLTAGSDLAGDQEVVCHNDLSPKNTVYRDGVPVAFLDWDIAAPGRRVHDVAHLCWQFVPLGPSVDPRVAARRVRLVVDAYGLEPCADLVDWVLWWQDRCWRGIESAAQAGDVAMVRLRDTGVVGAIRAAYEWTAVNRENLLARLGDDC
ncbi:phosphotransferase [Actinoplanes sp. NPDC049548]|uniref:phosphotransferase family protein n=1 Tax=Actinoplanes sp. NPDC049548 TaxID=3155152 RepID=UPI00344AF4A4